MVFDLQTSRVARDLGSGDPVDRNRISTNASISFGRDTRDRAWPALLLPLIAGCSLAQEPQKATLPAPAVEESRLLPGKYTVITCIAATKVTFLLK